MRPDQHVAFSDPHEIATAHTEAVYIFSVEGWCRKPTDQQYLWWMFCQPHNICQSFPCKYNFMCCFNCQPLYEYTKQRPFTYSCHGRNSFYVKYSPQWVPALLQSFEIPNVNNSKKIHKDSRFIIHNDAVHKCKHISGKDIETHSEKGPFFSKYFRTPQNFQTTHLLHQNILICLNLPANFPPLGQNLVANGASGWKVKDVKGTFWTACCKITSFDTGQKQITI